jgi:polyribonucleotide nucleotidyltransferase
VLCAVTAAKSVKEGQDFFPLTVHYQEKFRRRPHPRRLLQARTRRHGKGNAGFPPDRPSGPSAFPEGFYNEINVIAQVLSYDGETEPDIVAMIAASAALTISGVPFMGPIGAARVGFKDGEYQLNPSSAEVAEGRLDLVVAATDTAVMMVESEAKELTEDEMLGAVMFAHDESRKVVAIIELAEKAAKDPWEIDLTDNTADIKKKLKSLVGKDIAAAYKLTDKSARSTRSTRPRQGEGSLLRRDPADPDGRDQDLEEARGRHRAHRHPQGRPAHRRPHGHAGPPDRKHRRLPAAHARFGAVHAR